MIESNRNPSILDVQPSMGEIPGTIGAARIGNEIFIPKCSPAVYFAKFFHEVGHIAGDEVSFKGGGILTPEELEGSYVYLPESDADKLLHLLTDEPGHTDVDEFAKRLGEDIIKLFTKDTFSLAKVKTHYGMSQEELIRVVKSATTGSGDEISDSGALRVGYSRDTRNSEVSAYVTELGCMQILENTLMLNTHRPMQLFGTILYKEASPSHSRARNLAFYALDTNRVLPSMRDLREKTRK